MNSKYILILFSIYIMCICSSCSDFLKEVSQDEFEPKTASAFQELLMERDIQLPFVSILLQIY